MAAPPKSGIPSASNRRPGDTRTGTPALPSSRLVTYNGRDMEFRYPDNWRPYGQGSVISLAPDGGVCGPGDAHAPYGYTVTGGRLQIVWAQAARVQRAFALAASGAKLHAITRSTGLSAASVRRLLANRAYLGGIYGAPGAHPALVSAKRWAAAHKRR